jgi:hypothetical protein
MFQQAKNSKKQGDIGLGAAIGWYTSQGFTVCLPLTDSQDYDLIVDRNDVLERVQVKTTSYKNYYNRYVASLRVNGGNRSGTGKTKKFDALLVDRIFVITEQGTRYDIPTDIVSAMSVLSLGEKYDSYIV